MNISSMRIGRKIIASSGHDQKNIYVIKHKGSNQQRRMTSQSIDTFRPQSIHRLSLQKLRLAKPLSEAKQLLDECLYHREVQHSRVKLGCEMIKRLKNGKEVLTRVNKHNHYRNKL